jgi:hypothetical protein
VLKENDQNYHEKTVVNKITISVGYDGGYRDYTLYFPNIDLMNDEGVYDQVLRISDKEEDAREYFKRAVELAKSGKNVYDIYKELQQQIRNELREEKVKTLKEHIIDEMTSMNPHHEDFRKGMRVKKKTDSKTGHITEFDGHTATVKWDDGGEEDIQRNVLTGKDVSPTPTKQDNPLAKMPDLGKLGQDWLSKQVNEDPVGQQAAGNPDEEKEMRDAKIKALKEKLVKALKREGIKYNIGSAGTSTEYRKTVDPDLEKKLKSAGIQFTKSNI